MFIFENLKIVILIFKKHLKISGVSTRYERHCVTPSRYMYAPHAPRLKTAEAQVNYYGTGHVRIWIFVTQYKATDLTFLSSSNIKLRLTNNKARVSLGPESTTKVKVRRKQFLELIS